LSEQSEKTSKIIFLAVQSHYKQHIDDQKPFYFGFGFWIL
jgi:hypothetical protein